MHSSKFMTPPSGANGGGCPESDEPVPSMRYVRQLRRECEAWRRRLALAEREIARLRIALIIAQAGGTPSDLEGSR